MVEVRVASIGRRYRGRMEPRWPTRISSHEVIPVALDTWWPSKVHLAERAQPGQDAAPAAHTRWSKSSDLSAPLWRTVTLCGRPRAEILPDADDVDLLSSPEQWMCSSCWRIVEGWLTAPPPIEGEDAVVIRPGFDGGFSGWRSQVVVT